MALVGPAGEQLVAGVQLDMTAGRVDVAAAPAHREHVEPGIHVELELVEGRAVRGRAGAHGDPYHHFVALPQRDLDDRMHLLVLLDQPDHLLGRVAEVLGGLGQMEQAAQR